MANELVFIIHIPTMYGIYAGKRMGWQGEWYDSTVNAMTLNNYLVNEQGEDRPFEKFMFVSDDEADIQKDVCKYDGVTIFRFIPIRLQKMLMNNKFDMGKKLNKADGP